MAQLPSALEAQGEVAGDGEGEAPEGTKTNIESVWCTKCYGTPLNTVSIVLSCFVPQ